MAAAHLRLLRSLDLSNNDMKVIPPELGLVETHQTLVLNGLRWRRTPSQRHLPGTLAMLRLRCQRARARRGQCLSVEKQGQHLGNRRVCARVARLGETE